MTTKTKGFLFVFFQQFLFFLTLAGVIAVMVKIYHRTGEPTFKPSVFLPVFFLLCFFLAGMSFAYGGLLNKHLLKLGIFLSREQQETIRETVIDVSLVGAAICVLTDLYIRYW